MSFADQSEFAVRFEWGLAGLRATAQNAVIAIIDVLSFTTSVSVACGRGALVFPCDWNEEHAVALAMREHATLAARRGNEDMFRERFSLSPDSLLSISAATRIVLPSQNGSVLAHEASLDGRTCVAASIRNASATAAWLMGQNRSIAVIAAGERWPDGTLRFALEDFLGAGALIAHLSGSRSPEAATAEAAFRAAHTALRETLEQSSSGQELVQRGFANDVSLAAELSVERLVPVLHNGAFSGVS
jgi:2-phosphosulfolactate phosphatase